MIGKIIQGKKGYRPAVLIKFKKGKKHFSKILTPNVNLPSIERAVEYGRGIINHLEKHPYALDANKSVQKLK